MQTKGERKALFPSVGKLEKIVRWAFPAVSNRAENSTCRFNDCSAAEKEKPGPRLIGKEQYKTVIKRGTREKGKKKAEVEACDAGVRVRRRGRGCSGEEGNLIRKKTA